ncbi:MAG TPA: hypothetical protein VFZ41_00315 [Solirubrobacterales bacterium]
MAPGVRRPGTWLLVATLAAIGVAAAVDALRGGKEAAPSAVRQAATTDGNTAEEAPPAPAPAGSDDLIEAPLVGRRLTVTEEGVTFSFRLPKTVGWERFRSLPTERSAGGPISLNKSILGSQGAEAIIYWTSFPDGDHADPCANLLSPPVRGSVADLAAAVSTAPGTKLVRGPSDVTLGGRVAKHVVLRVREDVGCDPGFFYAWRDSYGGALWPRTGVGVTVSVWIVAVDGVRLFIAAATTEQASSELEKEIQQIIRSIRFDVASPNLVKIAKRLMEARNAYDAEKVMSLVADDGVTAQLRYSSAMDPTMGGVRLDRDQLALALEAERLYRVRYESFECRRDPVRVWAGGDAQVNCSYLMDNRLRQIAGHGPLRSSSGIRIRNGRIDLLGFSWLNIGFSPGGYRPAEAAPFMEWLEAEHPEAGGPGVRGELFRTQGQELIHILTRESLDLLAGYLEEYERSRNG